MTPATITAIELAWFEKGRARDIANRFKGVTPTMVERVWFIAKEQGRLPRISRPKGGFDWEKLLTDQYRSQPFQQFDQLQEVA